MKFTKHIHVLQLLSTIPTDVKPISTVGYRRVWPAEWEKECNDAWDHLFTYIHANWNTPANAIDTEFKVNVFDCREMLRMGYEELQTKLESLPPYFSEVIFPVAVARYLLRDLALPISHKNLTTFREFHNRYGAIILSY